LTARYGAWHDLVIVAVVGDSSDHTDPATHGVLVTT